MYTGWQKHGAMKFDQAKVYQSCLTNSSKAKMKAWTFINPKFMHGIIHPSNYKNKIRLFKAQFFEENTALFVPFRSNTQQ